MPRLILRKNRLLELSPLPNAHQLGIKAGVSSPTVDRYVRKPEVLEEVDLQVLSNFLLVGAGLTEQQVLDLKIGDLFEFIK